MFRMRRRRLRSLSKWKRSRHKEIVKGGKIEIDSLDRLMTGSSKFSHLQRAKKTAKTLTGLRCPVLHTAEFASFALHCFKMKHGTMHPDYKVVRALGSCRVLSPLPGSEGYGVLDWCHVSFIAISNDAPKVLFFVELVDFGYGEGFGLADFAISSPDDSAITYGCGFCPHAKNYPHPRGAHFAGHWDYEPINYASQQKLAIRFERQIISHLKKNSGVRPDNLWWDRIPNFEYPDSSWFSPLLSDDEYAELALLDISEEEDAEYEFVQTLYSHRQLCLVENYRYGYGHWCHVVFSAKRKNADVCPVHFFAELHDPGVKKFSLSTYCRFDPSDDGTEGGCGICPLSEEKYPHPANVSYTAGSWPHFGCLRSVNDPEHVYKGQHCSMCSNIDPNDF